MTGRLSGLLVLTACLMTGAVWAAQDRPLPDQDAFLAETRKHLEVDSTRQRDYMYVETRVDQKLDGDGRVKNESVKVFENYPGLPGEGRWERLISEDGRPVAPGALAERDRDRRKKAEQIASRQASEPAQERARQEREWDRQRRDRERAVDDIYRVFDITMLGRERIEGHDTIAFSLTPKADADPQTREGDQMRHFSVRAWVSESDHELVRLDAEAIDTLSFGLGVLARLHKGARLSFLRRKINDEVWLPAMSSYQGSARVGLLFVIRRGGRSEYSGYRKFSVDTSETFTKSSP